MFGLLQAIHLWIRSLQVLFAATVMRAFAFQLLVDNMSDCPYTEALQGNANPSPIWDDGETVYKGVLAELDEAEEALDNSADKMSMTDMIFKKDISGWRGYANALRCSIWIIWRHGVKYVVRMCLPSLQKAVKISSPILPVIRQVI